MVSGSGRPGGGGGGGCSGGGWEGAGGWPGGGGGGSGGGWEGPVGWPGGGGGGSGGGWEGAVGWPGGGGGGSGGGWEGPVGWPGGAGGYAVGGSGAGWVYARPAKGGYLSRGGLTRRERWRLLAGGAAWAGRAVAARCGRRTSPIRRAGIPLPGWTGELSASGICRHRRRRHRRARRRVLPARHAVPRHRPGGITAARRQARGLRRCRGRR